MFFFENKIFEQTINISLLISQSNATMFKAIIRNVKGFNILNATPIFSFINKKEGAKIDVLFDFVSMSFLFNQTKINSSSTKKNYQQKALVHK